MPISLMRIKFVCCLLFVYVLNYMQWSLAAVCELMISCYYTYINTQAEEILCNKREQCGKTGNIERVEAKLLIASDVLSLCLSWLHVYIQFALFQTVGLLHQRAISTAAIRIPANCMQIHLLLVLSFSSFFHSFFLTTSRLHTSRLAVYSKQIENKNHVC